MFISPHTPFPLLLPVCWMDPGLAEGEVALFFPSPAYCAGLILAWQRGELPYSFPLPNSCLLYCLDSSAEGLCSLAGAN